MVPLCALGILVTSMKDVCIFVEGFSNPTATAATTQQGQPTPFCPPGTVEAFTTFRLVNVHAMVDLEIAPQTAPWCAVTSGKDRGAC